MSHQEWNDELADLRRRAVDPVPDSVAARRVGEFAEEIHHLVAQIEYHARLVSGVWLGRMDHMHPGRAHWEGYMQEKAENIQRDVARLVILLGEAPVLTDALREDE